MARNLAKRPVRRGDLSVYLAQESGARPLPSGRLFATRTLPVYPERGRRASIVDGPSASVWRIGRSVAHLQASKPRSGEAEHGAVPSPQAPAWGTLWVLLGGTKNRQHWGGPAFVAPGFSLASSRSMQQTHGGRQFRGNENKPLTAISNRNTNERRNTATLPEPITSKFLIATKMHFSEEKAKSEEREKLRHARPTCAFPQWARLASGHSRGTLSGRCNVTPDFPIDFVGAGRASICPCRTGSN